MMFRQPSILWFLCLKCQKLHRHTPQQAHKCSHGVSTPHLLEIDQSDVTISARVKMNGYCTVDCSGWNCVHLTTISSKHKSLDQSKHLDSIIPCSHWSSICNQPWVKLCKVQNKSDIQVILESHCLLNYLFDINRSKYTVWLWIAASFELPLDYIMWTCTVAIKMFLI